MDTFPYKLQLGVGADARSIRLESLEEVRDLDIYPKSASPSPIDIFLLSLKSAAGIVLRGRIARFVHLLSSFY